MSCALWGKPSFLISCPWKTTCWILHASFLSGRSPQFACYYILSEESTLEFSNVMCLVGKALWVSCVMTFVLKENPLSFSCYVLCAEGKPSESEFLMSCPLCWRKALWVWVSHVMSFVLKESPLSEFLMLCPLCWRKALWVSHVMSFVLKESPLSLSFSCHVLCAEGKPSESEFLMSCPLCWKKTLGLGSLSIETEWQAGKEHYWRAGKDKN